MNGPLRIPVIGVFYKESGDFHDWLASVGAQRSTEIEPVPVIVVSRHSKHVDKLTAMARQFVNEGRIQKEDVQIMSDNVGPTKAFNAGVQHFQKRNSDCRCVASLDPDARFSPGTIPKLFSAFEQGPKVGMVSPIIVRPRADGNFRYPVSAVESVCHAGHFPSLPPRPSSLLINYWQFHFKRWNVEDVCSFLSLNPQAAPFSACFCASLWSTQMFEEIGFPDECQFRTLNCGEIGYRAQLRGWTGKFSPNAFAFHPNAPDEDYSRDRAIAENGSTAWHYYHAQALIALRYFPDELRNKAARRGDQSLPWEYYFPDLKGIDPYTDNARRQALFERWRDYDLRR